MLKCLFDIFRNFNEKYSKKFELSIFFRNRKLLNSIFRFQPISTMVADSSSPKLVHRHRTQATIPKVSEDDFDNEITTLDPAVAVKQLASMEFQTHEDELQKLKEIGTKTPILPSQIGTDFNFKRQIVWSNAIGFLVLHLFALVGIVQTLLYIPSLKTTMYCK